MLSAFAADTLAIRTEKTCIAQSFLFRSSCWPLPPHSSERRAHRLSTSPRRSWDFDQEEGLLDAARLALAAVPNGKVRSGEIEEEKGKPIYSFDIKVPGKAGITEVHIDPATGAVLGQEHEGDAPKPAGAKPKAAKPN